MAKHFGPQHAKNGYAAMGKHRNRPIYAAVQQKPGLKPKK